MSISTASMDSYLCPSCSSGMTDTKCSPRTGKSQNEPTAYEDGLRSGQVEGWKKELDDRVHHFGGDYSDFLKLFVPSNAPAIPHKSLKGAFSDYQPKRGQEKQNYRALVRIVHSHWMSDTHRLSRSQA